MDYVNGGVWDESSTEIPVTNSEQDSANHHNPFVPNDIDSDDESGDESLERNPKASPVLLKGPDKKRKKWADRQGECILKLTEVVEETEPESSFKDTIKQ